MPVTSSCKEADCYEPRYCRGWCKKHYSRWQRSGSPCLQGRKSRGYEWLKANIVDTDECIFWPFGAHYSGYGVLKIDGVQYRATHKALELAGRPRPGPEFQAAHAPEVCHEPSCVNPRHLRWATNTENSEDRVLDGTMLLGEENPASRLSEDDIVEIRARHAEGGVTYVALAEEYGVTNVSIANIIKRKTWSHV